MTEQPTPPPIADPSPADEPDASLSYEQARGALEDVVRRLEAGGITLEESLSLWERGERLALACQDRLDGARSRLAAVLDRDGGRAEDRTDRD